MSDISVKKPLRPNSPEEWALEQRVFDFLHNQEDVRVPPEAEAMIKELWAELVAREIWLKDYVIYSPNEFATSNECGFWNQDKFAWDTIDNATSLREIPEIFPPSVGNDARVVLKRQAAEHIG